MQKQWSKMSMSEVWDVLAKDMPEEFRRTFVKPVFPTRRWNVITTKESTSDRKSLLRVKEKLTEKTRIFKNDFESKKFKTKMYSIEVQSEL